METISSTFQNPLGRTSTLFVSQLTSYVGIGGVALFRIGSVYANRRYYDSTSGAGIGVHIPLGIEWRPNDPALSVFVELAPGMGFIPGTFGFF